MAGLMDGLGAGVPGALATIWNVQQQKKMNEQNLAFAEKSATTAFNRQKELINMQNAYNDPAAQMQRYVDAGLNPNLVYGTPNLSAGASSVSTGQIGNGVAPQLNTQFVSDVLTAKQMSLQDRALDIEESKVNSQNELNDAEIRRIFKGFDLTDAEVAEKRSLVELNNKMMTEIDSRISLLTEQQKAQLLENLYNERTMEDRVSLLKSEAKIKNDEASMFLEMQRAIIAEKLGNAAAANASVAQYQATARKLNFEVDEIMPSLKILYDNQANKEDKLAAIAEIEGKIKNAFGYDQAQADIVSKLLASDPNVKDLVHKVGNGKVKTANWLEEQINKLTYGKGKNK